MEGLELRQEAQRQAAAQRVENRVAERQEKREMLARPGGVGKADSPERVAKRLDRLSRYYAGETLPVAPVSLPSVVGAPFGTVLGGGNHVGVASPEDTGRALDAAGIVLERIINTPDFVDIRYLEAGVAAARAVGRVAIRDRAGRPGGYGSGSMVSPRLFLTNHHVISSSEVAAASAVEFNYQDGVDGNPLQPTLVRLDPDAFFLADEKLDFALVAAAGDDAVVEFGFNRLVQAEGKAIIGERVTIVQHPHGEKKQVVLRENRIIDVLESFLHYEADTEPGSSGSPVFNDQWEVVALHHASVAAPERTDLGGFVNEGIRISRIVAFVRSQSLPPAMAVLADQLLGSERVVAAVRRTQRLGEEAPPSLVAAPASALSTDQPAPHAPSPLPGVSFTLPLEISVRLGGTAGVRTISSTNGGSNGSRAHAGNGTVSEAIQIDPDYANREGYVPHFLGTGNLHVPLPKLADQLVPKASVNREASGEPRYVFPYHHFSIAMNRERRLAFFTAVNIDGRLSRRLRRERDRWYFDPRVPVSEQTGEAVYVDNDLDRGHLVRRLDPAWSTSEPAAKAANDDTFHFTNCTPQHKDFNQNQTTWAGLEDYILENADTRDLRVSVFTGPVFSDDDDEYRGVKLPRQFWKVVVMARRTGALSATAYLLSQEQLIRGLEVDGDFSYGAYRTFQVPIRHIEGLTALSFGRLADGDPLGSLEAAGLVREVHSSDDLIL